MSVFLQPIYSVTVGAGGTTSVTFNNIPQGFTDLRLDLSLRADGTDPQISLIQLNGDGVSGLYCSTRLGSNGSSAFADTAFSFDQRNWLFENMNIVVAQGTTNTFASQTIHFSDYTSGKFKMVYGESVSESNATVYGSGNNSIGIYSESGIWRNTNPITRIDITCSGSQKFAQHSTLTLYGVSSAYDTVTPTAPQISSVTDLGGDISVAFTTSNNDIVDSYYVQTSTGTNRTYGTTSPIVIDGVTKSSSIQYTATAVNSFGSSTSSNSSAITTVNDYGSIASYVFPDSSSNIIRFTNIPQHYKHLQIRAMVRSTRTFSGNALDVLSMALNEEYFTQSHSDIGNVNSNLRQSAYNPGHGIALIVAASTGGNATNANVFSPVVCDILDYTDTSKYKTTRSQYGVDPNLTSGDTSFLGQTSNLFPTFAPVQTMFLVCSNGNFVQNSVISLYGIG